MKTHNIYIMFAATAMLLASCTQDELIGNYSSNDIVQISSAHIALETTTRVNSLEDGKVFENADKILLVNNSRSDSGNGNKRGIYTAAVSDGSTSWSLTEGVVLWTPGNEANNFTAYYPASEVFAMPADQSTEEGIKSADRMTATAVASRGNAVNLSFARQMARVTFVPTLVGGLTAINSFTVHAKDENNTTVTPYAADGNYTVILTPGTYAAGEEIVSVVATTETQEFSFVGKTKTDLLIEAGKAYTFNIQVGKDAILFTDVTVKDWTDNSLGSVDAETTSYIYDANTKTLTVERAYLHSNLAELITEYTALGAERFVLGGDNVKVSGIQSPRLITVVLSCMELDFSSFYDNHNVNLELHNIKSLRSGAIYGNDAITELEIPASVTDIKGNPFFTYDLDLDLAPIPNPNLTSVTVAPGNKTFQVIDNQLFNISEGKVLVTDLFGYDSESITVPSDVTAIGPYAFSYFTNLRSITIPNSVTSIGSEAFYNCRGLTSVTIPNSVTSIGDYTFDDCRSLTSVTIPKSVTSIGEYAFISCSSLKKVIVPDIAAWCSIAFERSQSNPLYYAEHLYSDETTEITKLIIPNSVTSIGDYTFYGCSGLTSVTIPNSVTSIGGSAFSGCSSLTSVTISNSVTSIGDYALSCEHLTKVNYGGTKEQARMLFKLGYPFYYESNPTIICTDGEITYSDIMGEGA